MAIQAVFSKANGKPASTEADKFQIGARADVHAHFQCQAYLDAAETSGDELQQLAKMIPNFGETKVHLKALDATPACKRHLAETTHGLGLVT